MPRKPFEKGNKLGKGRPRLSDMEKMFRKMTTAQVVDMLSKFGGMSKQAISDHANDPECPMLERTFCKIWLMAEEQAKQST